MTEYDKQIQRLKRAIRESMKRGYEFEPREVRSYRPEYDFLEEAVYNLDLEDIKKITPSVLRSYHGVTYNPTRDVKDYMRRHDIDIPNTKQGETLKGTEGEALEKALAHEKGKFTRQYKKKQARKEAAENLTEYFQTGVEDKELQAITRGTLILEEVRQAIKTWDYGEVYSEAKQINPNIRVTQYYVENIKKPHKNTLESILESQIEAYNEQGLDGEMVVAKKLEERAADIQDKIRLILYGSGGQKDEQNGDQKIRQELAELAEILKGGVLTPEENAEINDMLIQIETEEG